MNDEKEINILDYFVFPLYHWKAILCTTLVFLLLGNVFFALKAAGRKNTDSPEESTALVHTEPADKSEEEIHVERLQKIVESEHYYIRNSILMSMDSYHVWKSNHSIYIAVDEHSAVKPSDIIYGYTLLLSDEKVMEQVASELKLETWQVRELIQVSAGSSNSSSDDDSSHYVSSNDSKVMNIVVSANSQELAQQIMNTLLEAVADVENTLHLSYGPFKTHVLLDSCYEMIDPLVSQSRDNVLNVMKNDEKALETALSSLPLGTVSSGTSPVRYSVLFAILGFLLSFAYFNLKIMTGHKLYSAFYLRKFSGLVHLGSVLEDKKVGRFGLRLRKLEDRALSSDDDAYALVASNIRNFAGEKKNLLVTGDVPSETCRAAAEKLGAHLPGTNLICKGSLLENSESVAALSSSDGVILIEQCMISRRDHIAKEIATVQGTSTPIVGCVLIDF